MSTAPLRRTDKEMSVDDVNALLARAVSLRLATIGADGWPYVLPLLFVRLDDELFVHTTRADGHFRRNVQHDPRVCFELDEPGEVFGYGATLCDTSIAYRSVIGYGVIREVDERESKERFCTALMRKYAGHIQGRPEGVFPRLDFIRVYAVTIERMTGKQTPAR
jgi:nitroimidazol reductase NimA-like FMN-containing flavoprotein (pyridoxamine 5'-phosphate oxidase superfamily)